MLRVRGLRHVHSDVMDDDNSTYLDWNRNIQWHRGRRLTESKIGRMWEHKQSTVEARGICVAYGWAYDSRKDNKIKHKWGPTDVDDRTYLLIVRRETILLTRKSIFNFYFIF